MRSPVGLINPETRDNFYKLYLKDNIDDIVNIRKALNKIKSMQTKISLMQELVPRNFRKLEECIAILEREVETEAGSMRTAHMTTIRQCKAQVDLFMQLHDRNYSQAEFARYKRRTVLELIMEYIGQDDNVGLICTAYVNEAMLHYDKILEKIIEFEIEGTPQGGDRYFVEKLLPLGKDYEEILAGRKEKDSIGTMAGYWAGVKQKLSEEDFVAFSKDHSKYFAALKVCMAKGRKALAYIYSIVKCGVRRRIEKLDLLRFDFKLRKLTKLSPPEHYNIERAAAECSSDTFGSFITRGGTDPLALIKGMSVSCTD